MIEIAETLDRSASRWEGARCTPEEAGCTSQMSGGVAVGQHELAVTLAAAVGRPLGPLLHAWAGEVRQRTASWQLGQRLRHVFTVFLLCFVSCLFILYFLRHLFLFSFHPLLLNPVYYDAFLSAFNDTFSVHFLPSRIFVFHPFFLPRFLYSLSFVI